MQRILFLWDFRFILAHTKTIHLMKPVRLILALTALLALLSCHDDWEYSSDGRYMLSFSADTVSMDTVFTGVASASVWFKVYNPNEVGLRFDAVMGGGTASHFRMNMDGEGGSTITSLELGAGDSLFCFVSVNIPADGQTEIFQTFDSIRFILESGNVQFVRLSASARNAVVLKGERIESDTRLTSRMPYIIHDSLYVKEGVTLTLEPGTSLYFHKGAVLDVAGRLVAQGKPDSVILMRGDRLDDMLDDLPYDLLDGQWGGIRLRSGSYLNTLEWCDIHGADFGIRADSAGCDMLKLSVVSSVIHNIKGDGLKATGCDIEVANSQITNARGACVDIAGGRSEFNFCTIAAFSLWEGAGQAVVLSDSRDGKGVGFGGASFRNCIITGRHTSELITQFADSVKNTAPYSVSNSLLMVRDTTDSRFSNVRFENNRNKAYGASNFRNRARIDYRSVFELDSLSQARGIADSASALWPMDLAGVNRPADGADAGCFQYKP